MNYRHAVWFLCSLALSATQCFAEDERVFFGNLHSHTSYSDGVGTPEDAFKHARDVANNNHRSLCNGPRTSYGETPVIQDS
jgi:hypothetical protein